jgi:hypothetical protein
VLLIDQSQTLGLWVSNLCLIYHKSLNLVYVDTIPTAILECIHSLQNHTKGRKINDYLTSAERSASTIFKTSFGSDLNVFTIGFHKSIVSFATIPDLSDAILEKAAIDAGFRSRRDIGLYLRRLIVSHQDTLATKVD